MLQVSEKQSACTTMNQLSPPFWLQDPTLIMLMAAALVSGSLRHVYTLAWYFPGLNGTTTLWVNLDALPAQTLCPQSEYTHWPSVCWPCPCQFLTP